MGYYTQMLKDSAVLKTVNGSDENNRPNIIALEEIDCKIEFKKSIAVSATGEEITSSGRLFTESVGISSAEAILSGATGSPMANKTASNVCSSFVFIFKPLVFGVF